MGIKMPKRGHMAERFDDLHEVIVSQALEVTRLKNLNEALLDDLRMYKKIVQARADNLVEGNKEKENGTIEDNEET